MRRRVLGRAGARLASEAWHLAAAAGSRLQPPAACFRAGEQPSQMAATCCLLRRWVQAAAVAAQLFAARAPLASSGMPLHEHLGCSN